HHREQRHFPIGYSNHARTPREPAEHHGLRLVIDAAAHAGTFAGTITVSVKGHEFDEIPIPAPRGAGMMSVLSKHRINPEPDRCAHHRLDCLELHA
ncbi:MAG: hypothetical protein WAL14_21740, partial [Pseudolabrys sp.]